MITYILEPIKRQWYNAGEKPGVLIKQTQKNTNRSGKKPKKLKTLYDQIKIHVEKKELGREFIEPISSFRIPINIIASSDGAFVQYDRDGVAYSKALSAE